MDALLLLPSLSTCPAHSNLTACRRGTRMGRRERVPLRRSHSHVQQTGSLTASTEYWKWMRSGEGSRRRGLVRAKVASEEEVDDVSPATAASDGVAESVALLKTAAKTKKTSASEICAAFKTLEKAKVDPSDFLQTIGGTKSPGRTWMLIFASNKDEYNTPGGGGKYFPITAVQRFDAEASRIENGVFFGPLGALTFSGNFSWEKRKLAFIFHTINLTFGSLGPFSISFGSKEKEIDKGDPFFIWYYADDEILVAKGKSGGTAFWVRCANVKNTQAL